jgi:hypothetical protein
MQEGYLGLGFRAALDAVEKPGQTEQEIRSLESHKGAYGKVLVGDPEKRFVLELLSIKA